MSTHLESAWYRGAPWLWLLRPLEALFRAVSACRRYCYRKGWFQSYRAARPVIVVGNITVGGTGKTPVVIALVEALAERGIRCGVVSRGYGGKSAEYPLRLDDTVDAAECGDEPLLIHRRTGAPCVVDPDRPRAVDMLLQDTSVQLVISDDGLQHYALNRDMEIVLLDQQRRLGNGFCLPAGPLREPPSRLQDVDFVLYRGSADAIEGVPYRADVWVNLVTGERRQLHAFRQQDGLQALAGIGQPDQFFATLDALGLHYQRHVFADHHAYTAQDLAALAGDTVLMTEKDAVKCRAFAGENAWYLHIDACLPEALIEAAAGLVLSSTPEREIQCLSQ